MWSLEMRWRPFLAEYGQFDAWLMDYCRHAEKVFGEGREGY